MTVRISWAVEGDAPPVSDVDAERAANAALGHGGRSGLRLDVIFVDDETLCEMHERFLGDPGETDVIAFDLTEETPLAVGEVDPGPEAEVYISLDRARRVAAQRGVPVEREIVLYIVHGALHLCGFDDHDPEDRRAMRAAEASVLEGLGYAPDDAPHDID